MLYKILFFISICLHFVSIGFAANPYYDDFNGNEIDFTKWTDCQRGEIRNGQLWLDLFGSNSWTATRCNVVEENITNYLSSLVSISKHSYTVSDSSVAVKVGGIFFNDTFDGSNGYNNWEGNIFADVRLQLYNGILYAKAVVVRYNNSSGSSKTPLSKYFTQPINFETKYLLSIEFIDSAIIFKCNDESLIFSIKTPIYPTNKLNRRLTVMIYADMGEQGYVGGEFDDVCLADTCSKTTFIPSVNYLLLKPKN